MFIGDFHSIPTYKYCFFFLNLLAWVPSTLCSFSIIIAHLCGFTLLSQVEDWDVLKILDFDHGSKFILHQLIDCCLEFEIGT